MGYIYRIVETISLLIVEHTIKDLSSKRFKEGMHKIQMKFFFAIIFLITYTFFLALILIYFAKNVF